MTRGELFKKHVEENFGKDACWGMGPDTLEDLLLASDADYRENPRTSCATCIYGRTANFEKVCQRIGCSTTSRAKHTLSVGWPHAAPAPAEPVTFDPNAFPYF